MFFLKDFFAEISGSKPTPKPVNPDLSTCLSSSPGREPFQTISDSPVMSSPVKNEMLKHSSSSESLKSEKSSALFIKSFVFYPEVPIRLDYQGKYIAIEQVKRLLCDFTRFKLFSKLFFAFSFSSSENCIVTGVKLEFSKL